MMSVDSMRPLAEPLFGHRAAIDSASPSPGGVGSGWYLPVKRVLDFVLALLLAVPAVLVTLFACLAVRLTSRGPALYSQIRLGRNGWPFRIYKVRTMVHDCEQHGGVRWSTPGDWRVTTVGRFLRRTHLDELPQLWNVLLGDMSLIGPRPERPEFVPRLEATIPRYRERLRVRPGLTGLAQVQLPPDTDLESVRRKLACDLTYLCHLDAWLDFRILAATILYLLHLPGLGALHLPETPTEAQRDTPVEEIPVLSVGRREPHARRS
jgi:lipopolysaccharide/colanic/teichoic acid biosynthesis glycosyltransferase